VSEKSGQIHFTSDRYLHPLFELNALLTEGRKKMDPKDFDEKP